MTRVFPILAAVATVAFLALGGGAASAMNLIGNSHGGGAPGGPASSSGKSCGAATPLHPPDYRAGPGGAGFLHASRALAALADVAEDQGTFVASDDSCARRELGSSGLRKASSGVAAGLNIAETDNRPWPISVDGGRPAFRVARRRTRASPRAARLFGLAESAPVAPILSRWPGAAGESPRGVAVRFSRRAGSCPQGAGRCMK